MIPKPMMILPTATSNNKHKASEYDSVSPDHLMQLNNTAEFHHLAWYFLCVPFLYYTQPLFASIYGLLIDRDESPLGPALTLGCENMLGTADCCHIVSQQSITKQM